MARSTRAGCADQSRPSKTHRHQGLGNVVGSAVLYRPRLPARHPPCSALRFCSMGSLATHCSYPQWPLSWDMVVAMYDWGEFVGVEFAHCCGVFVGGPSASGRDLAAVASGRTSGILGVGVGRRGGVGGRPPVAGSGLIGPGDQGDGDRGLWSHCCGDRGRTVLVRPDVTPSPLLTCVFGVVGVYPCGIGPVIGFGAEKIVGVLGCCVVGVTRQRDVGPGSGVPRLPVVGCPDSGSTGSGPPTSRAGGARGAQPSACSVARGARPART